MVVKEGHAANDNKRNASQAITALIHTKLRSSPVRKKSVCLISTYIFANGQDRPGPNLIKQGLTLRRGNRTISGVVNTQPEQNTHDIAPTNKVAKNGYRDRRRRTPCHVAHDHDAPHHQTASRHRAKPKAMLRRVSFRFQIFISSFETLSFFAELQANVKQKNAEWCCVMQARCCLSRLQRVGPDGCEKARWSRCDIANAVAPQVFVIGITAVVKCR